MKLDLQGKSVLITGASKGIGLATAWAFAREGCALHLAARSAQLLEDAKQAIDRSVASFASWKSKTAFERSAVLRKWYELILGDEAKTLQGVFVTVDPARDTPAILGDYVSFVSYRIVGVTGSQAEIDKVVKDWNVTAEKVPNDDGSYLMNHTASVFLVNSKGEFAGTIAYGEDTNTALEKIKRLVANS